jgi:hypothetical protein
MNIDGRSIWMIPYTGGSGNVPAWNTPISNNGATGKLIGVHSTLTAASTATGAAMPATGFIRVKQKTGNYIAAALNGLTATASDEGRVGWIEIVGDESATITANRLGNFNITGAWYEVGTTSGVSNQTMQIPNNGLQRYVAGVFIEQTVGGNDYEFYPNAGIVDATGTELERGKVVWINNAGLVRIGNSGTLTNGYVPTSGLKVVVGNVFLENCGTASRNLNVIPNPLVVTRYDFTTTGGGVLNIDKCNMAWYLSCNQAYSVNVSNSGFVDAISLSEVATSMTFTNMGVGNKPTTNLVVSPLSMSLCFAGGVFTDCVFQRTQTIASNSTSLIFTDIAGFTFTRLTTRCSVTRGHVGFVSITATRANNCAFTNLKMVDGHFSLVTCTNVTITNMSYVNGVSLTTTTSNPLSAIVLSAGCSNIVISGFLLPVTNNHPYTSLVAINAAGCKNIKIRNIGTRVAPLSLGSASATGLIFSLANGAAASDVRIQRVYCSNTRTGIMTADNSSTDVLMESVFGDYADAADLSAALNMTQKGLGCTKALTAQTSVYGTHWIDYFTSATVGRIAVVMNEPTALTTSQVTLSNGAGFTSAGGLYMPVIGHSVFFETPYFILGHAGFPANPIAMSGGTLTNYTYIFQIDKNDGNGWSQESSPLDATLFGFVLELMTGIDPSLGFKLRLRITTSTTNTSLITSFYINTESSAAAQEYQYPLDVLTLAVNGVVAGSRIRVTKTIDDSLLFNQLCSGTFFNFTTEYSGEVRIEIRNGLTTDSYKPWFTIVTVGSGATVTALQEKDY